MAGSVTALKTVMTVFQCLMMQTNLTDRESRYGKQGMSDTAQRVGQRVITIVSVSLRFPFALGANKKRMFTLTGFHARFMGRGRNDFYFIGLS